ncbi:RNP-1 like RNA-binding protein [Nitzschia inconspicua]|uniref:RNP-1 like RNA-binding protein n=1 Tax=Nitzschia inconspicua TaxID=303405 RepID=A0A9K3LN43_9STRA|nr:RNP-1 like RNA-binding protein [Nitzschia inconspicua]
MATMTKTTTAPPNRQKKSVENTVFVRFVPPPQHKVMRHQVEDIFSQIGPIKKSSWINSSSSNTNNKLDDPDAQNTGSSNNNSSSNSKGYGFVKYVSQQDAHNASQELDNTKIQMEGQEYILKVELASLSASPTKDKRSQTMHKQDKNPSAKDGTVSNNNNKVDDNHDGDDALLLKKKSCRIILRNLSFYSKEQQIRRIMEEQFGTIVDIHLPKVQNNLLGFGFVTFADQASAQKAVDKKQIELHKRTVQIDWSVPKNVHQQQKKQPKETMKDEHVGSVNAKQGGDTADGDNTSDGSSSDSDSDNDDKSENDGEDDNDSLDGSSKDDGESDDEGDVANEDDDSNNTGEQDIHDTSVDKKCCLFLRNLPFDTTRHDLFQLFSKYGFIKGIYLVRDKDTGMLKGTAFVTYSQSSSAQRAIDDAASSTISEGTSVASFVSQKQATKESTSTGGVLPINKGSLMLKGRKILVDFAVDKETAATFDSKEHQVPSADRRNLYLQAESRVESSSSEPNANNANTWDDLPPQDQKKRQSALKDKTTKLQSPIFFINPHRLSFRNMAKHVDEAGLQQLCQLAVTRGLEKRLVGAKDQIAHWKALGEMTTRDVLAKVQTMEANGEEVIPGWDKSVNIKEYVPSVFIDRVFGPSGKKKDAPSRGFGFAEFTHHVHALACLRELNNNPTYSRDYAAGGKAADAMKKKTRKIKKSGTTGGSNDYIGDDGRVHIPRLIVDFTVENKTKAKKQAERRIQQQVNQQKQKLENQEKRKSHNDDVDDDDTKKKKSRGAKQREKKRQKRESGEEEKERQAELQAKALADARREMKKERLEQKRRLKEEMKQKSVKPPKKKQKHGRMDEEDEKFEKIVRSYATELEAAREGQQNTKNARAALKEKRWFE